MKKIAVLGMSVMLVLSLCACSFSFSTANFQNLSMASEITEYTFKPVKPTSTFETTTPVIYLTGSLNNAPDGTVIKAKWLYAEEDPAVEIDSATYEAQESNTDFQFNLSMPTNGWSVGKYEIKLYIDDKIEKAVKFEVTDGTAATTEAATTDAPTTEAVIETISFQDLKTGDTFDEEAFILESIKSSFTAATPTIYLTGAFNDASGDRELSAKWLYLEDSPATVIDSYAFTMTPSDTVFYFSEDMPDSGWSTGRYEIKLFVDGVYIESVYFNVA